MKNQIGLRMKRYEETARPKLAPRIPVIARIDGRAFHTFTRGCAKPYDADLHACMWAAAKAICADISGCKLAYVQSDEISLLITDYETYNTQPHFDYELAKLCSTAAATTSVAFLVEYLKRFSQKADTLLQGKGLPTFDSRFYNVPREDVANYFLWRQRDAERNSLTMQAQALYPHSQLEKRGAGARHQMLFEKGINWNNLPTPVKRGVCIVRETYEMPLETGQTKNRSRWVVDENIPMFSTAEGRLYINRLVNPPEPE